MAILCRSPYLISNCNARAKEAWERRGSEMKADLKKRKEELKSSSKVYLQPLCQDGIQVFCKGYTLIVTELANLT